MLLYSRGVFRHRGGALPPNSIKVLRYRKDLLPRWGPDRRRLRPHRGVISELRIKGIARAVQHAHLPERHTDRVWLSMQRRTDVNRYQRTLMPLAPQSPPDSGERKTKAIRCLPGGVANRGRSSMLKVWHGPCVTNAPSACNGAELYER